MDDLTKSLIQEFIRGELQVQLPALVEEAVRDAASRVVPPLVTASLEGALPGLVADVQGATSVSAPDVLADPRDVIAARVSQELPELLGKQLPALVAGLTFPAPKRGQRGKPGETPSIAHLEARVADAVERLEAREAETARRLAAQVDALRPPSIAHLEARVANTLNQVESQVGARLAALGVMKGTQ